MTLDDVRRRIDRLAALSLGLMKEQALWRKGDDPLLRLERQAYLQALGDATAGVEGARVVLAKACLRNRERRAG